MLTSSGGTSQQLSLLLSEKGSWWLACFPFTLPPKLRKNSDQFSCYTAKRKGKEKKKGKENSNFYIAMYFLLWTKAAFIAVTSATRTQKCVRPEICFQVIFRAMTLAKRQGSLGNSLSCHWSHRSFLCIPTKNLWNFTKLTEDLSPYSPS